MSDDPTSLDRLHDIALPPAVPWWPLAPGWHVVLGIVLMAALFLARRAWKTWKANAYRRAALRELASAQDAPAIAEILRRTALAVAPRELIAGKSAAAWPDWLSAHAAVAMPTTVREALAAGIYSPRTQESAVAPLREYAERWITQHKLPADRC
jgi:hypothetical protein